MSKTELKNNVAIEVTEEQYKLARAKLSGIVFHRQDKNTNKYYIKLGMSKYKDEVVKILGL